VKALQLCPIIGTFVLTGGCLLSCTVLGSWTGNTNNVFIKTFMGRDKRIVRKLVFYLKCTFLLLYFCCALLWGCCGLIIQYFEHNTKSISSPGFWRSHLWVSLIQRKRSNIFGENG